MASRLSPMPVSVSASFPDLQVVSSVKYQSFVWFLCEQWHVYTISFRSFSCKFWICQLSKRKLSQLMTVSMETVRMAKSRKERTYQSALIYLETMGVFHLPKNYGNSGWVVNGTWFFGSSHWKISGKNGIPEKVVPFSRWKLLNENLCSIYRFLAFRTSSMPFAVF